MGAEIGAVDKGANEADEGEGEVVDETADETKKNKLDVRSVWQNLNLTLSNGSQRARGFPAQIKVTSSLRYQTCVWVVSGAKVKMGENISVPPT